MTVRETSGIHDDLMRFKPPELTPNAWAVKAGVSRTVWADMRRHGNPSRRTLEKLLAAAGSSLAEFEALRVSGGRSLQEGAASTVGDRGSSAWGGAQLPLLPLIASASGGEWGDPTLRIEATLLRMDEVLQRVQRPVALANDPGAYALTIVGDSMWPRFRAGRRIAVSPKAPPTIGDDVIVKLKRDSGPTGADSAATAALIKELVRSNRDGLELRQFNPDVTFHVPAAEIFAIEKVLGELV
jgi:hypothetical protein